MERFLQKLLLLLFETSTGCYQLMLQMYTICFTAHVLLKNKAVHFSPQRTYLPSIIHYKYYAYSLRGKETFQLSEVQRSLLTHSTLLFVYNVLKSCILPTIFKKTFCIFYFCIFFLLALKMKSQQKNLTCTLFTSTFLQSDLIQSCWSTGIYLRDSLSHQGC